MTRQQNARVAGFTFLLYIAIGVTQAIVGSGAGAGNDAVSRLASMASHALQVRTNALLGLLTAFTALTLAAALYGLTREEDGDLATLALSFRIGEGLLGAVPTMVSLTLLSLATEQSAGATTAAASTVALLRIRSMATLVGALFFAIGSTIFAYLLLHSRLIPRGLALLGIAASLLLVVALPFQLVGLLTGAAAQAIWAPMAAFEVPLGVWLLVRGVYEVRAASPE